MNNADYIDVHNHGTFSPLDGFGFPLDSVARAAELGRPALALTDHGSVSGHVQFAKAAAQCGIKPLFGVEFYTVSGPEDRRQEKDHLTVLAETQSGYRNMLSLASQSYREGYYYRACIDGEALAERADGLLMFSGCSKGYIPKRIIAGNYEAAYRAIGSIKDILKDRFYLELQPFAYPDTIASNCYLIAAAKQLGIRPILTMDVHHPREEDWQYRRLLHAGLFRKTAMQIDQEYGAQGMRYPTVHHQMEIERLQSLAYSVGIDDEVFTAAIGSTREVAERCSVQLEKAPPLVYPVEDSTEYFLQLIREGFAKRNPHPVDAYIAQAEHEIDVIIGKNFVDYMLVVWDYISWAKANQIWVGPARGSSAGSVVCWLLGITEVDPLEHGLLFERFIDPDRNDYPDIDTDFEDEGRELVKQYLRNKWGHDRVANVGTYLSYGTKSALNDAAKAYQDKRVEAFKVYITSAQGNDANIKETIDSFPEARAIAQSNPYLYEMAYGVEGQIKAYGQHAAGVVIADKPLQDYLAIYWQENEDRSERDVAVACYDYDDLEHLGLLKFDILGLTDLRALKMMCFASGMTLEDMYKIPLNDPAMMNVFRTQDLLGIFQFEGGATRAVLAGMVDIKDFYELADISAMSRPGPLGSGAVQRYHHNRHLSLPEHYHPALAPFTSSTQGQLLYQEQVVRMVRELGDFEWGDANKFRKAIAKKEGSQEIEKYRLKFREGCAHKGWDADEADKVFNLLGTFGAYGFNLSHAVSYTMISCHLAWFKAHHPTEFYWAMISTEKDTAKRRVLIAEFIRKGGRILGPKIGKSRELWTIEAPGIIRGGWLHIDGIGPKTAAELARVQATTPEELAAKVDKRIVNKTVRARLEQADVFSDIEEQDFMGFRAEAAAFATIPYSRTPISDLKFDSQIKDIVTAGRVVEFRRRSMNEPRLIARRNGLTFDEPKCVEWLEVEVVDDSGVHCDFNFTRKFGYPLWGAQVMSTFQPKDIMIIVGNKYPGNMRVNVTNLVGKWVP